MSPRLPPGPRSPRLVQTVAWWARPVPFMERCRARYGPRFTMRLLINDPVVLLCDPDEIRQLFTARPDVLRPGEGSRAALEPILGRNSVILLDEDEHLEERKLMLPAFHGERMARLTDLLSDVAEREIGSWPRGEPFALHPHLQALTLEVILRAVFGLDVGERLDGLRDRLTRLLEVITRPVGISPVVQRTIGRREFAEITRLKEEIEGLIFDLIDERRADAEGGGKRDDVLAMLLAARHEDGSPMSARELHDELMTMLVAGHETTASELAWAVERLARTPAVLGRLVDEIDRGEDGDDGDAYLTATIQETLRRRPVLPTAGPRAVAKPITIGDWTYEPGASLAAATYLVHHDPTIYPDPYAFRPERFLGSPPGTYTWIPFGGGRRRCLGASFALLEMKVVLRALLRQVELRADREGVQVWRRRGITLTPSGGARAVLRDRGRESVPV